MTKSAPDKLLFLISVFTNNSQEWIDVFSSPFPRIPGYPKRGKTIKKAISFLLSQEKLDYKKDKERILIRPTKKAFFLLSQKYPFYHSFISSWDNRFHLVFYNIPEVERKKRDALRRILKMHHLARWQNSLWLTPHKIDFLIEELKKLGLFHYVQTIEATLYLKKDQQLIKNIFQTEKLNNEYFLLYRFLQTAFKKRISRKKLIAIFRKGFLDYQNLLNQDPGLPLSLIKDSWYGVKVRLMLKKVQRLL